MNNKKHILVYILIVIFGIPLFFLFINLFVHKLPYSSPTLLPVVTPVSVDNFSILSTSPTDGQTNVYPNEIQISFTTDVPLSSQSDFSFTVSPSLSYTPVLANPFPSKNIILQTLGSLKQDASYSISIYNRSKQLIKSWQFTTNSQKPQDSSQLFTQQEQDYNTKYYPLLAYVPYSTTYFSVDYTDKLTLKVTIVGTDSGGSETVDQVQQQVNDWIKSKGVDPSTHKIIYIDNAHLQP